MEECSGLSGMVIRDSDGSVSGCSYRERCKVFKGSGGPAVKALYALEWVIRANRWLRSEGYGSVSTSELFDHAKKVAEFYEEYVRIRTE